MCFFQRTSFPNAIAHIDCNAFFASVEQAYNPKLKGTPVLVAGMGNSCVITASYEARKYNISTGTPVWEAQKICPEAIVIPGNFRHYMIFHQKFISIIKEFTPDIEATSIDECYIDLKGLRRLYRKSYSQICQDIKETIKAKLGITVSIGLSTSKVLAKTASNYKKPDGLTVVRGKEIEKFLKITPLNKVKGLGHNTRALLHKQGINTTMEFVKAPPEKIKRLLGKTGNEMQLELRGYSIRKIITEQALPKSLSRTRSFELTNDKEKIHHELIKNLSLAFWHLRKKKLKTRNITIMLRSKDYKVYGEEIRVPEDLNCDLSIVNHVNKAFNRVYHRNMQYRSSGIITTNLRHEDNIPPTLFPNEIESASQTSLFEKIDNINEKYGTNTVRIGSTMSPSQQKDAFHKLNMPYLGESL